MNERSSEKSWHPVFLVMGTWLIAGRKKGVRKERGVGTWWGDVGVVTRCVTHEAEKGGIAAHPDCQNVEGKC
jgi:hypothetical protein